MDLMTAIGATRANATILTALLAVPPDQVDDAPAWTAERDAMGAELWGKGFGATRCQPVLNALAGPALTISAIEDRAFTCGWRAPERDTPAPPLSPWTPERDKLGAELWRQGVRAPACVGPLNELPGPALSASTISERASRRRWPRDVVLARGRGAHLRPAPAPFGTFSEDADPESIRLLMAPDPTLATCRTRTAAELCEAGTCQWPFGHPGEPSFLWCAEVAKPGARWPYCSVHRRMALFKPALAKAA